MLAIKIQDILGFSQLMLDERIGSKITRFSLPLLRSPRNQTHAVK